MRRRCDARVVEAVDLGLEVARGAVEDRAGREDARRDDDARRAHLGRGEDLARCRCDGSCDRRDAEGERRRRSTQFCCGHDLRRCPCAPCQCTSMRPGMIVLPVRVDDLARRPAPSTLARGPTAVMRLPSTTTVAVLDDLVALHGDDAAADERDRARSGRRRRRRSRCRRPCSGGCGQLLGRAGAGTRSVRAGRA